MRDAVAAKRHHELLVRQGPTEASETSIRAKGHGSGGDKRERRQLIMSSLPSLQTTCKCHGRKKSRGSEINKRGRRVIRRGGRDDGGS